MLLEEQEKDQPNLIVLPDENFDQVKKQIDENPLTLSNPDEVAKQQAQATAQAQLREAQVAPQFNTVENNQSILILFIL